MLQDKDSEQVLKVQPDQNFLKRMVRECYPHILGEDETIISIYMTDLTPEGKYKNGWLVITDRKLFTGYEPEVEPRILSGEEREQLEPEMTIPLSGIRDIRVEHHVGNGLLIVETGKDIHRLVRFSLTFTDDFDRAVAEIADLVFESEEEKEKYQTGEQPLKRNKRCPDCGTLIRRGVCMNCLEKKTLLKRLFKYLRPYIPHAIASFIMLLTTSIIGLAPPYLTGLLVDEVLITGDLARLRNLVLILALIYISSSGITGLRSYIMTIMGQGIIRDLRSEVFQHLQYLKLRFFDTVRTGAILSRTTADTRNLQRFITYSSQNLLQQILMIFAIGFMLFRYDASLALVTLAPMPLVVIATKMFSNKVHGIYHRVWVRRALMKSVVADAIPGIKVVKSFAQEEQEIKKFDHRSDQVFNEWVNVGKFRSMFRPFLRFATHLGTLIIWGYGGYLVIMTPRLSVGDLVAFLYYVNQFYNPLRQVFEFSDVVQEAATAASRVFEVLDTEPERNVGEEEPEDKVRLRDLKGEIEFRNVSFAYEVHEPVLKNINVRIEPGEMVGLVGSSGAGKTTMVNLIPRMYDVTSGQVLIDGHDIRDIELKSLRDQIGVVLQSPMLFYGSIAENIAYGKPDASLEEIIWAANAANAHDFIMEFPDGYDSHTGERGLRLSGGQKQRISIARALLKNPRILILDEATSSVDTETEKLIQDAIDRLVQDRTTVAIAHRLSTLRNADRLLVLEEGEVIEEGTHDELIEADGVFARLLRMQSEAASSRAI